MPKVTFNSKQAADKFVDAYQRKIKMDLAKNAQKRAEFIRDILKADCSDRKFFIMEKLTKIALRFNKKGAFIVMKIFGYGVESETSQEGGQIKENIKFLKKGEVIASRNFYIKPQRVPDVYFPKDEKAS